MTRGQRLFTETPFALMAAIHLPPLPGSPGFDGDAKAVFARAVREAAQLAEWGFQGVIVENFGDAPFLPGAVGPEVVAAMAVCVQRVRDACPKLSIGVNVLRCDPLAAMAIATCAGADFIRVNVHCGTRLTDQGLIQGRAHETLRRRREWCAEKIAILADIRVKHSRPLAPSPLEDEVAELQDRALADGILVTGPRTGAPPTPEQLARVRGLARVPLYLASGLNPENAVLTRLVDGAIVSSTLREKGRAGAPLERQRADALLEAVKKARDSLAD